MVFQEGKKNKKKARETERDTIASKPPIFLDHAPNDITAPVENPPCCVQRGAFKAKPNRRETERQCVQNQDVNEGKRKKTKKNRPVETQPIQDVKKSKRKKGSKQMSAIATPSRSPDADANARLLVDAAMTKMDHAAPYEHTLLVSYLQRFVPVVAVRDRQPSVGEFPRLR